MTAGYSALATSTFVARADWTTIDSYPAACGAGDYVTAIGDTLTCGTPAGSGTVNSSATGTVAYYPGTAASVYGTTTLFIKEDGNVGIGDTTPSAKLDINGGLAVQGTGTSTIAGDLDVADDFEADMAFITTLKGVGTGTSTIAGDLDIADGLEAAIGWFTSALYSVNITISSLLTTVNATITGILKIPSGATQLTSSAGELTIDTTSDQLRYYGTATNTIVKFYTIGFSYATSTWAGTTTLSLAPAMANLTMKGIYCDMAAGTLNMRVGDGTNYMAMLNASTTANYFDFGTTNTTFTAGEEILVDIGTPASSPTRIGCRLKYQYDVD